MINTLKPFVISTGERLVPNPFSGTYSVSLMIGNSVASVEFDRYLRYVYGDKEFDAYIQTRKGEVRERYYQQKYGR